MLVSLSQVAPAIRKVVLCLAGLLALVGLLSVPADAQPAGVVVRPLVCDRPINQEVLLKNTYTPASKKIRS
jgi:hypothetical protein